MTKPTKEEILALFNVDVTEQKKKVKDYIQDKTNSYEDRLEVYLNTPEILRNHDEWIWHVEAGGKEVSWYDDFSVAKYQRVEVRDIISDGLKNPEWIFEWEEDPETKTLLIKDFINAALDDCVHSFTFDW